MGPEGPEGGGGESRTQTEETAHPCDKPYSSTYGLLQIRTGWHAEEILLWVGDGLGI